MAPRFRLYFGDGWNLFDFTIVVLSLILMIFLGFAAAIRGLNTLIVEIIQRRLFVPIPALHCDHQHLQLQRLLLV